MINSIKERVKHMNDILKSERLIIKNIDKVDINSLCYLLCNDEISKTYMIPSFNNDEEVIKLASALINESSNKYHFFYGIYFNNKMIGFVNDVNQKDASIELGYVIDPDYQNKGFATEMLKTMISHLLKCGYKIIETGAFSNNLASIRVMEKCGMKKESKEEDIKYRNVNHHCIYYIYQKNDEVLND